MSEDQDTLFKFPCEYPLKVMGAATSEFEALVVGIIRKHVPDLGEAAIQIRYSKENKYVSITAMIMAQSKQQLDDLYRDLSAQKEVLMAL